VELGESHILYGGDMNFDENVPDSTRNLEPLLESLGYSFSSEMIDSDESASLEELNDEINLGENGDNDEVDINEDYCLSEMSDISDDEDGEPLFDLDANLGDDGGILGVEPNLGKYISKSNT
jgi:hypothetical protein